MNSIDRDLNQVTRCWLLLRSQPETPVSPFNLLSQCSRRKIWPFAPSLRVQCIQVAFGTGTSKDFEARRAIGSQATTKYQTGMKDRGIRNDVRARRTKILYRCSYANHLDFRPPCSSAEIGEDMDTNGFKFHAG